MTHAKPYSLVLYDQAKVLAGFCLEHGGKAFAGWAVPVVFQYCFFHIGARTAFVVRHNGTIAAAMFVWGAPEVEIRARAAAGDSTFNWRTSQDKADALFVSEVLRRPGLQPEKNAKVMAKLFRQAASRWPRWQQKKIFTFRNGFLVELEPETIARLIYGQTASGLNAPRNDRGAEEAEVSK